MRHMTRAMAAALFFGILAGAGAQAADMAEALREARDKHYEMETMRVAYYARKELDMQIHLLQRNRSQQEAVVRGMRIEIDGFPARRNSIQEAYYQQWLLERSVLTQLDARIAATQSEIEAMEHSALGEAEANGNRPRSTHRRGLLNEFPRVEGECRDAFRALKDAADEAANHSGRTRDEVVREALGIPARAGSADPFLVAFKRFSDAPKSAKAPAKRSRGRKPTF